MENLAECQLSAGITPGPTGVLLEAAAAWHGVAQSILGGRQTGMTLSPIMQPPRQFQADCGSQGLVSRKAPEGSGDLRPSSSAIFQKIRVYSHPLPGAWVDIRSRYQRRLKGFEFVPTKCHFVSLTTD